MLFWQAPTAVQRAMGAVPSSACPTLQGGCAAAPLATSWCVGWHACRHCPAWPHSRPALTSRAASPKSRSAMGALTALTAPMSLTVSACPWQGRARVLAAHGVGSLPSLPQFGKGGLTWVSADLCPSLQAPPWRWGHRFPQWHHPECPMWKNRNQPYPQLHPSLSSPAPACPQPLAPRSMESPSSYTPALRRCWGLCRAAVRRVTCVGTALSRLGE